MVGPVEVSSGDSPEDSPRDATPQDKAPADTEEGERRVQDKRGEARERLRKTVEVSVGAKEAIPLPDAVTADLSIGRPPPWRDTSCDAVVSSWQRPTPQERILRDGVPWISHKPRLCCTYQNVPRASFTTTAFYVISSEIRRRAT